ncbi:membrane protein [Roseibium aquae]|uniref:Membrane protein n=1 Tax=Roseibium aquae TaxID=1323746 RepID=A0A916T8E3_9HYPH|nr:SIMPL domain-containing protein [Roseibium aquae]GGB35637.1 membrane protein [Roseibium aquae]
MFEIARTAFGPKISRTLLALGGALALAVSAGLPAAAQPASDPVSHITITGRGEVNVAPDMAVITTRVVTTGTTAPEALSQNSTDLSAVISQIKAAGIEERDIQTSGFSIYPRYDHSDNRNGNPPRIVGYEVANGVQVNIRNLEKLGDILTLVVASGANQIGGIQFDVSDPGSKLDEARTRAVADARHKAEVFAKAAGAELGTVMSISEAGATLPRPVGMRLEKAMMAADAAPIEAGESTLSASVTITWQLIGG